jgi:hypothetical protein
MIEPGIYRSDVDGHLFMLKIDPLLITCVVCIEACDRSKFKTLQEFRQAALAFVNKHGALDERLADNLAQILPRKS